MIEFVCGRAGSGKSEYVAARIREALATIDNPIASGRKFYLIVPEQQAVVWESRIARSFPPEAAAVVEIVNFTRLCEMVGRQYGGLATRTISRGGKAAMMWATLTSLSGVLEIYGAGVRPERAAPALLSAISEMKRSGITPDQLSEAAARLEAEEESRPLARRASELAIIGAAYQNLLTARYDDEEDALAHLARRLKDTPFFAGTEVFVDSFFSLTAVENEILYHIFRQADHVTLTFACPARDTGEAQFASPRAYLTAMRKAADRAGQRIHVTELTGNHRAQTAELSYLEENLWRFDALPYTGEASSIRLITAGDRYKEAEAAVCCIEKLVRGGAAYGEIALIARDASRLRGILDTALLRAGIPCFLSEESDVPGRPAARLLFAALTAVGGGWRREDLILMAKTGLCALTDDECDALELYTETWHIRGWRAFTTPWNMNPDGYVATLTPRGETQLRNANAAREKLVTPLKQFSDLFHAGGAPIQEICRGLYELLCAFGVWDTLHTSSAALYESDRRREAAEEAQMWDVLMDALDTLAEVLPDAHADPAAFSALLRQVLSAVTIGSIPSGTDEVVIGSADQVRLGEIEHIILLGAVDGEFPGAPEENGFFSDTDKLRLEGEGIVLSAKTEERMKEELLWFYRAAALPHRSLTILMPKTDGGTPLSPSLAVERIVGLFPTVSIEDADAWTPEEAIWQPAQAANAVLALRGTKAGDALLALGVIPEEETAAIPLSGKDESVSAETAALLFPRDIALTQSRMDSFVLCRFGYYCRYVLKLEGQKEASLSAVNVGTFLHRVFELYFTRTEGEEYPRPDERIQTLTEEIVADVVREICPEGQSGGRAAYLFRRLKRCVLPILRSLDAEFAQSAFRPAAVEVKMGSGKNEIPAQAIPTGDGHMVHLRGTVDRLDTWRDGDITYVRVIDYKTGKKKFAREDIAIGVNVQLLLYLFSILHAPPGAFRQSLTGRTDGELRAAGALYMSTQPGGSTADVLLTPEAAEAQVQEDILRSGVLIGDEAVLRAMDAQLSGRFIPVKAKKEGYSSSATVTQAELDELETTLHRAIARVGEEMCAGGAQAQPLSLHGKVACEYCEMKSLCRRGTDTAATTTDTEETDE